MWKGKMPVLESRNLKRCSFQELTFVKHLLSDPRMSPARAARKMGFKDPAQAGGNMIRRPWVMDLIQREQKKVLERMQLDVDSVVAFLSRALFLNPSDFFEPSENGGWSLKDIRDLPEEIGMLMEGVKFKQTETARSDGTLSVNTEGEIKLPSKMKLLEMAFDYLGLSSKTKHGINNEVNVNVGVGIPDLVTKVERVRRNQIVDGEFEETEERELKEIEMKEEEK